MLTIGRICKFSWQNLLLNVEILEKHSFLGNPVLCSYLKLQIITFRYAIAWIETRSATHSDVFTPIHTKGICSNCYGEVFIHISLEWTKTLSQYICSYLPPRKRQEFPPSRDCESAMHCSLSSIHKPCRYPNSIFKLANHTTNDTRQLQAMPHTPLMTVLHPFDFANFFESISIHLVLQNRYSNHLHHVHIWQVPSQLSSGDICQIQMCSSTGNQCLHELWK